MPIRALFYWTQAVSGIKIYTLENTLNLRVQIQKIHKLERILAENEPRVALGSFHPEFLTDEIGDYFGTDVSFAENPFQKSKVEIPIVNVGKTPISNIQVKISSPTLKKIIDEWEKVGINSKLNISFFTQLYAIYGDNFDIKYEIIDTNSKRKNIASKTVQTYRSRVAVLRTVARI